MTLDRRIHAYRPDLADASLRGAVAADTFVEPVIRQCLGGVLPLLNEPRKDAGLISQIRHGEFLDVFEIRDDGFAWVQNRIDRYVGYIPLTGKLGESIAMMSNRVCALRTFVYPEANMKTPVIDELTLGSFVSISGEKNGFLELTNGGYVFAGHVRPTESANEPDYVFTAGRMLNAPYLWGGRTPKGIDCSGLVQLALEMAGIDWPRDSDQQREAFGKPLSGHWRDQSWQRGDVVFFPGHVGIMTGVDHIIHASARVMEVTVEPLADVVDRDNSIIAVTEKNMITN